MDQHSQPNVTPEKIKPFLKKATLDQIDVLHRLSHYVIRGRAPEEKPAGREQILELVEEGNNRQRLLIIQAAYHMVRRDRLRDTFQIQK